MRTFTRKIWGFLRLIIGLGVVGLLLISINRSSSLIEFTVPPCDVSSGTVYRDASGVIGGAARGSRLGGR